MCIFFNYSPEKNVTKRWKSYNNIKKKNKLKKWKTTPNKDKKVYFYLKIGMEPV